MLLLSRKTEEETTTKAVEKAKEKTEEKAIANKKKAEMRLQQKPM